MSDNMELWNKLGKTDPAATKGFVRGGGFRGTAIKPMWSFKRMTEEFGPCGIGWGIEQPTFQTVASGNDVLVYCTVSIWYKSGGNVVFGVGGDLAVKAGKPDDEAFKKAFTDAVTNALKLIGVGADVHMGLFDDSKYVNEMKAEYADKPAPEAPKPVRITASQLKEEDAWNKRNADIDADLVDVHSLTQFDAMAKAHVSEVQAGGWPKDWVEALRDRLMAERKAFQAANTPSVGEIVADIQNQFPGARIVSTLEAG